MEAKFFSHEEKLIAVERLRMNQMGVSSGVWKWDHFREAMLDLKTWLWFAMLMAVSYVSLFAVQIGATAYIKQNPKRRDIDVRPSHSASVWI